MSENNTSAATRRAHMVAWSARVASLQCVLGCLASVACVGGTAYSQNSPGVQSPPENGGSVAKQTAPVNGARSVAGTPEVAEFMQKFAGRGVMSDGSHPTPADISEKQFQLSDGLQIELMASEPEISQPLFLSWDSRGRMWVVQYRQYQFPAGLKIIRYDNHLRAVFDRIPEPPPLGPSGKDIISVLEDTDGDGRYDKQQDVITGLNIATSVQVGRGGIWVLNPPYLLFYPDADRDDVPDGPPEVHLSGFGLQDTHSVANSLLWGPDGWLYGANGSTTVGTVSSAVSKGVEFQGQCIWRYDPESRVFEIYAEGGGNTFSLEIDAEGRVFSGTNGGGTRGFFYPQGSYSSKNWGKHGPLTNPYAFGYFEAMESKGDRSRFPQAFTIYEGGLFPPEFDGNIFAPNAMQNLVWRSKRFANGSTFRTEDQANLCGSPDRWFRPVYAGVGPDGCFYMADWYDTRLSHVSPLDDWHKESGRVYRVFPDETQPTYALGDLHEKSSEALVDLFSHPNKWVRQRAVLELGWRGDHAIVPRLERLVDEQQSLEALWTIDGLQSLTAERAARWMQSERAAIRRWVVRALGDRSRDHAELIALASRESDVEVRAQLASTARRLSSENGLAIVRELLSHDQDAADPHLPLLLWWAIETHADDWTRIKAMFSEQAVWQLPLVNQHIVGRLMQRYASPLPGAAQSAQDAGLQRCSELVALAPDAQSRRMLLIGLTRAFQGRSMPNLPDALAGYLEEYQQSLGSAGLVIAIQRGESAAIDEALRIVADPSSDLVLRGDLLRGLADVRDQRAQDLLLKLAVGGTREPALQRSALAALRNFSDPRIATEIVGRLGSSISDEHELRDTACRTLATRKPWAITLLDEVLQWRLQARQIPTDVAQQLRAYGDPEVVALAEKALGKSVSVSSEDKLQRMRRLRTAIADRPGQAAVGAPLFAKHCGVCHKLFGEGNAIGPALDAYDRGNADFWLVAMLDPSAEIREGYQSYAALTTDGRLISGMIEAQTAAAITLRGADNQTTTIATEDLEELRALETSLMPENVLDGLSDDQIRDLLTYMMQGAKR